MSSNLAVSLPARTPRELPQRRIEIVSTRAQRRARPRPMYAIIVVSGLFIVFMVQLLLSIVVSDGAYTISSLQVKQADLTRSAQNLTETVDVLASTQNLATQAESLGMVLSSTTPAFLNLATGEVVGKSKSATGDTSGALGGDGSLVPNSLLAGEEAEETATTDETDAAASESNPGLTVVDNTAAAETDTGVIETSAPSGGAAGTAVTSSNTLPTPVTR
jgi:hypothetical protein